jgi:hypothetical protein
VHFVRTGGSNLFSLSYGGSKRGEGSEIACAHFSYIVCRCSYSHNGRIQLFFWIMVDPNWWRVWKSCCFFLFLDDFAQCFIVNCLFVCLSFFTILNNFSVIWWRSDFIGGRENPDTLYWCIWGETIDLPQVNWQTSVRAEFGPARAGGERPRGMRPMS